MRSRHAREVTIVDWQSPRVLVIDESEPWRRSLERGLPAHGFSVLSAATLSAGRDLVGREDVDVVVLDFQWTDGCGIRILPELRSLRPTAAILVCTAHGSVAAAVAAMWAGAHDFLLKPTSPDQVAASIERTVDALQGGQPSFRDAIPAAPMPLDRVQWEHIQRVLMECDWNISMAARRLGIHRQSLQRKLRKVPALRGDGAG
jgi:two-component system response regulator RegA